MAIMKEEKTSQKSPLPHGNPVWEKGDVIQINLDSKNMFGGLLMIVTEPKSWGAQGYFDIPGRGKAYLRPRFDEGVKVGRVEWIDDDEDEDEGE